MARDLGVKCTNNQPYYFISYNSEDVINVMDFVKHLEQNEIPMWYDKGIEIGNKWENEIAEKIENCQAVIMFLSRNIFIKDDSYVYKEYELATEYSKKNVYVIMIDEIKKPEVPIRFRTWWTNITKLQCINAFEYSSIKECVQVLVESIQNQRAGDGITLKFRDKKELLKYYDEKIRMYDLNRNLDNFVGWMMNTLNFTRNTSLRYKDSLKQMSKTDLYKKIHSVPIYEIPEKEELSVTIQRLFEREEFWELDKTHKNLYSAAMKRYFQFFRATLDEESCH